MAEKNLIAMACDSRMFEQAKLCLETVWQHCNYEIEVGLIAINLGEPEVAWLAEHRVKVFEDFRSLPRYADAPDYAVAMTCRPYLPKIFPGYDVYMWVDADVRFCGAHAFEFYLGIGAEAQTNIAIVQEIDPTYVFVQNPGAATEYQEFKFRRIKTVFGIEAAQEVLYFYPYNAGIFSMRRESAVWDAYAAKLEIAMRAGFHHLLEQDAMLLAVLQAGGAAVGPPILNWICSVSIPKFNTTEQRWVRPDYPHLPIAALHLTNSFHDAPVVGQKVTWYEFYKRIGLTT